MITKKVISHKKRHSCRLKIFCVAQERNTFRKKQLVLFLKNLVSDEKDFVVAQNLRSVWILNHTAPIWIGSNWHFIRNFIFFIRSLKTKKKNKKKLALTSNYYVSQEIWLGNSKKLICIDQSRFYIFSHPREFENVKHNFKVFWLF